jgi:aryl-alcohol dehydrogenase-like predicted oxidoreductase
VASVVKAALGKGISWFDTAEAYGKGRSEQALSAALKSLGVAPGAVVVATKWFPFFRTAASIGRTIGDRLAFLGGYPIDLHQIHQPMSFSPIPAQMREMAKLLKAGKVRSIGVSNFSARQMEEAHAALAAQGIPLASNQVRYSLLDRGIERNGILDSARKLGVTIIAYSPLAQGLLTGKFHDRPELAAKISGPRKLMGAYKPGKLARIAPLVDELQSIGRAYGVSAGVVALNWLVNAYGEAVVAIPGASKPSQAEESALAMGFRLTDAEMARIDERSRAVDNTARGRAA